MALRHTLHGPSGIPGPWTATAPPAGAATPTAAACPATPPAAAAARWAASGATTTWAWRGIAATNTAHGAVRPGTGISGFQGISRAEVDFTMIYQTFLS